MAQQENLRLSQQENTYPYKSIQYGKYTLSSDLGGTSVHVSCCIPGTRTKCRVAVQRATTTTTENDILCCRTISKVVRYMAPLNTYPASRIPSSPSRIITPPRGVTAPLMTSPREVTAPLKPSPRDVTAPLKPSPQLKASSD